MEHRQLGGYFDILGNLAVFTNGFVAWHWGDSEQRRSAGASRMATGLLWNAPNLILAKYGAQPLDRQLSRLEHKLAAHLQHEGIPLDVKSLKEADEEKRRGFFKKMEDFFYNYPVEINNACVAIASLGMLKSGVTRIRAGEKMAGWGNIGVFGLAAASSLAGILIPEETDEQIAAKGQSHTLWGMVKKHPLCYANVLMLAADMTEGVNAWGEFKTAQAMPKDAAFRPYGFMISALSAATLGLFGMGDSMVGFGSKKNCCGDHKQYEEDIHQLVKEAARILNAQPEKERTAVVKKMADYLVKQREMRMLDYDSAKLQKEILNVIKSHTPQPEAIEMEVVGKHTGKLAARQTPAPAIDTGRS